MVGTGIGLAPFAKGYDEEARRRGGAPVVRVTPAISRGMVGLGIAGRF